MLLMTTNPVPGTQLIHCMRARSPRSFRRVLQLMTSSMTPRFWLIGLATGHGTSHPPPASGYPVADVDHQTTARGPAPCRPASVTARAHAPAQRPAAEFRPAAGKPALRAAGQCAAACVQPRESRPHNADGASGSGCGGSGCSASGSGCADIL